MSDPPRARLIYSTSAGSVCVVCGWAQTDCRCFGTLSAGEEPVPAQVMAKLRIEKQGRGGKTVTVIDGLPRNRVFLENLASELKRAVGTGGGAGDGRVELQGDRRERLRVMLAQRGFAVKG